MSRDSCEGVCGVGQVGRSSAAAAAADQTGRSSTEHDSEQLHEENQIQIVTNTACIYSQLLAHFASFFYFH